MNKPVSQMNVAVLKGGISSEREVSLRSGAAVAQALSGKVGSVVEVDIQSKDFILPLGIDFAFVALHGEFGEDGQIQSILEERKILYSGAGIEESRNGFDKILSKLLFEKANVKTPGFEILDMPQAHLSKLHAPVVVKPPCQGSSVGIEIIKSEELIPGALQKGYEYGSRLLIEEFHQGRELTVGVIGGEVLPIVEIKPKSGFYDYQNKYTKGASEYQVPAELSPEETEVVQAEALKAYHAITGNLVYGRVDVILDAQKNPWVLEVNTIPGMTETSLLPKAAGAMGISFPGLCLKVIVESLKARLSISEVLL